MLACGDFGDENHLPVRVADIVALHRFALAGRTACRHRAAGSSNIFTARRRAAGFDKISEAEEMYGAGVRIIWSLLDQGNAHGSS